MTMPNEGSTFRHASFVFSSFNSYLYCFLWTNQSTNITHTKSWNGKCFVIFKLKKWIFPANFYFLLFRSENIEIKLELIWFFPFNLQKRKVCVILTLGHSYAFVINKYCVGFSNWPKHFTKIDDLSRKVHDQRFKTVCMF